jgi:hypothetical protein
MSEMDDVEIPHWLKWVFITINRVGFPILAFLLMWKMCNESIAKVQVAIEQNTVVLMEVRDTLARMER